MFTFAHLARVRVLVAELAECWNVLPGATIRARVNPVISFQAARAACSAKQLMFLSFLILIPLADRPGKRSGINGLRS